LAALAPRRWRRGDTRERDLSPRFALVALLGLAAAEAHAEDEPLRRQVAWSTCRPPWWNDEQFLAALRIELRELGGELVTERGHAIILSASDCKQADEPL